MQLREEFDIPYCENACARQMLDLYLPQDVGDNMPVIVYFYGGGLESGARENQRERARELAREGMAVAIPDYRLIPDARYPDFFEDAAAATEWVWRSIASYGGDPEKIFVGGHSAGAYLAMMITLDQHYLARPAMDGLKLAGGLFASGQPTTHFNLLKQDGVDPRKLVVDERAPLYHVSEQGPPLLILYTEHDMENRVPQTELLLSTLAHFRYASPVEAHFLKGENHGSYIHPRPDGPSLLCRYTAGFVRRITQGNADK